MQPNFDYLSAEGMQARDLVELAAVAALHGQQFIDDDGCCHDTALQAYWLASKCRFDRWGRALRRLREATDTSGSPTTPVRALLEEILSSEALTRLWAAVLAAYDQRHETDLVRPIATSVLTAHVDFRNRALGMLQNGSQVRQADARRLLRLHRRVGRWVDLLVAYLQRYYEVSQFAIRPDRCRDFAIDLRHEDRLPGQQYSRPLTLDSLKKALCHELYPSSPNADLNFRIGASVVSCFDAPDLESTGTLHWLWQFRLLNKTTDCEGMIRQLLETS